MGGNVAEWVNDVYRVPVPNEAIEEDPLGTLRAITTRSGAPVGVSVVCESFD